MRSNSREVIVIAHNSYIALFSFLALRVNDIDE